MKMAAGSGAAELPAPAALQGWRPILRWAAVFTLWGAAAIHASQIRNHLDEWPPAGLTFLGLAAIEAALGAVLAFGESFSLTMGAIAVSLATIWLWALSRTIGIPFGPDAGIPEPVGRPDLMATVLETVTALVLIPLAASKPTPGREARKPPVWYLSIGAIGLLTATLTWFAVQPTGVVCGGHGGAPLLTGPLVPIDGHSILSRGTPTTEARVGETLGLVVGQLRNCGSDPVTVHSARVITASGSAAFGSSFWVVPSGLTQPGRPISTSFLHRDGTPLPGEATIETEGSAGLPTLVLEVRAVASGSFFVNGIEITYAALGRAYTSPYATVAELSVG